MAKSDSEPHFDIEGTINTLENRLGRLRVLYEQYFLGLEKRPPLTPQKEVVRLIRLLETTSIRNTSLKFRFSGLQQKFNTYRTYWSRTCRQIENGTYIRHVQKVKHKAKRRQEEEARYEEAINKAVAAEAQAAHEAPPPSAGQYTAEASSLADQFLNQLSTERYRAPEAPAANPPAPAPQRQQRTLGGPPVRGLSSEQLQQRNAKLRALKMKLGIDPDGEKQAPAQNTPAPPPPQRSVSSPRIPTPAQARRPAPPPPRRGPARPTPAPGVSDNQRRALSEAGISQGRLNNIYKSLVQAKKNCNESTQKISMDSVARSIAKQAPSIKAKHGAKSVDFKVVIKNGRAYLKPVPK